MEAATPPAPPAPQYEITRQQHEQYFDEAGNTQSRWRIDFQTTSGTKSFVEVPDADYNSANVAQMIGQRVRTIEEVEALGKPE